MLSRLQFRPYLDRVRDREAAKGGGGLLVNIGVGRVGQGDDGLESAGLHDKLVVRDSTAEVGEGAPYVKLGHGIGRVGEGKESI
jgi:hypothetical protein